MKCHKPGTDEEARVQVFANGLHCPEYILPNADTNTDPNTIECFIPISDGDQITLLGKFQGSILHGSIDLLADGSFLCDKRIEGSKTGEVKLASRKIDFEKVFDTPKPEGWTSIYPHTKLVEGNLHVKPLEDLTAVGSGDGLSVGSLAIIISINQKTDDMYSPSPLYSVTACGKWRERETDDVADPGITATHELEVKITDDDVHKNRQSKHHRHAQQTRFGLKPWAKFIFYYRSHQALKEAGCILKRDESQALEVRAASDASVISTTQISNGTQSSKETTEEQGGVIATRKASTPAHGNSMFMTPPPPQAAAKKQKLFGQSLSKESSLVLLTRDSLPYDDRDSVDMSDLFTDSRTLAANDDVTAAPFSVFNKMTENSPTTKSPSDQYGLDNEHQEVQKTLSGAQASVDSTAMSASLETPITPSIESAEKVQEEDVTMANTSPPTENVEVIVKEESIEPPQEDSMLQDVSKIAPEQHIPSSNGDVPSPTNATSPAPEHNSPEPIEQHVINSTSKTFEPPITPSTATLKRSASSMTDLRESTPSSKKPRMSAKLAAILARKEAAKQRKGDLKAALEVQKALKKAEEEKMRALEAKEIGRYEQEAADEEQSVQDLEEAVEREKAEAREIRMEREMFEKGMMEE